MSRINVLARARRYQEEICLAALNFASYGADRSPRVEMEIN